MQVTQMTAREMRATIPTAGMLCEAVEILVSRGWRFVASCRPDKPPYTYGWWVNDDHPTKHRPRGDSKNFHFSAWDTLMLYVAPEK